MMFGKNVNKLVRFLVIFTILLLGSFGVASAATGLNVVLSSQNPDPVEPGNFVYVNVKVSNSGSTSIQKASISLKENENFRVAKGESVRKELGVIPAYSSLDGATSYVIAKYKIYVDEDTPTGLNTLSFTVNTPSGAYDYDFDVLVQDEHPIVQIKSIDITKVSPGMSAKIILVVKNINAIDLKNVKVALALNEISDNIITMEKGSNEKVLSLLKSGKEEEVVFDVTISPNAQSVPYLIPIDLTYKDTLGNSFENTVYGSIKVYSGPYLSLNVDSQEVYTIGKGKVSLAIANPGSSKIKGVQMEVLKSDDYKVIEGDNQYVGDLNPDDFQTLPLIVYINNAESAVMKVKLTYFDSYDNPIEKVVDVPLKIYDADELAQLGFANGSGGSFGYFAMFVVLLVGLILGYVIFNVRNKKKKNNK